ncbi:MAG: thiopurine S-methyltransferase [Oleibacter sp.]|nr:thiopurine S-methyltransferase [Thalassolituus sp.]
MNPDFWLERWQENEIGFHLNDTNPVLLRHWYTMPVDIGARVLMPLCGKSVDVLWLLKQGFQVVGVELSEIALDALADAIEAEFGLAVDKQKVNGHWLYRAAGIRLICADWFTLTAKELGAVEAVYDRAALIALPPEMRSAYSKHLLHLVGTVPQLLVTMNYDQELMNGPPFAVSVEDVSTYYGDASEGQWLHCDVLEERELINEEPRFRQRGLTSLQQTVYRLTKRIA